MLVENGEIIEKSNFKRAKFEGCIFAIGGKNGKYDKLVMKNMEKNEHLHLTIKALPDGKVDLHLKNELSDTYESVNLAKIITLLRLAYQDVGKFVEHFNPSEGRFARLPALLIKPPLFVAVMKNKELTMSIREACVLVGSVATIKQADILMGYVDDWKAGEQYLLFRNGDHYVRIPMLAFAKHALRCLNESFEFTDSEKSFFRLEEYERTKGMRARIIRTVKRILYLMQPAYYRLATQ